MIYWLSSGAANSLKCNDKKVKNFWKRVGKVLYITPRDNLPENRASVTIEDIRLSNGSIEFKLIELVK